MPKHTIIVGADEAGRLLAGELSRAGETVSLIDLDPDACELAGGLKGVSVYCADATDVWVLRHAGAEEAKCLIAATSSDKLNLLVCQIARASFGRDGGTMRLVARANNSGNLSAFEAAGIETMSPARAAATILENMVLRPSLLRLLAAGSGPEHVMEVTVSPEGGAGRSLAELALHGCVVAALKRSDRLVVPNGSTRLEAGDVLTLIGAESAVYAARGKLDGTD